MRIIGAFGMGKKKARLTYLQKLISHHAFSLMYLHYKNIPTDHISHQTYHTLTEKFKLQKAQFAKQSLEFKVLLEKCSFTQASPRFQNSYKTHWNSLAIKAERIISNTPHWWHRQPTNRKQHRNRYHKFRYQSRRNKEILENAGRNVVNLIKNPNVTISQNALAFLDLGHGFVLPQKTSKENLYLEFNRFKNRLKNKIPEFQKASADTSTSSPDMSELSLLSSDSDVLTRNCSVPPALIPPTLESRYDKVANPIADTIIQQATHVVSDIQQKPIGTPRVNKIYFKGFKELKSLVDNRIIDIRKADKGGKTVLVDYSTRTSIEKRELLKVVEKSADGIPVEYEYKSVEKIQTSEIKSRMLELHKLDFATRNEVSAVSGVLVGGKDGTLRNKEGDLKTTYIISNREYYTNFPAPYVYPLYKIHKYPEQDLHNLDPTKLSARLITALGTSPTSRCQRFLQQILDPVAREYAGDEYCKDSMHFLARIEETKSNFSENKSATNLSFIAVDVEALYPSANLKFVKMALSDALYTVYKLSEEVRSALVDLILYCNEAYVVNDKKCFKISNGIITGSLCAVPMANIFLSWVKRQIWNSIPVSYRRAVVNYTRYIDDIFIIWKSTPNAAEKFISKLKTAFNKYDLKLTHEVQQSSLPFLDIRVYKDDTGSIQTTLYRKELAAESFLDGTSNHRRSVFIGIVKSQSVRIRRICSEDSMYKIELDHLKTRCKNSNYPEKLYTAIIESAKSYSRTIPSTDACLAPKEPPKNNDILWVCEYTSGKSSTFQKLQNFAQKINNSIFKTKKFKLSIVPSVQPSQSRLLYNNKNKPKTKTTKCGQQKCSLCKHLPISNKYTVLSENGNPLEVYTSANCQSGGIYTFTCIDCECNYVGKTIQFETRFKQHTASSGTSAISKHLEICPLPVETEKSKKRDSLQNKFQFRLLTDMDSRGKFSLGEHEKVYIQRLQSSINCQKDE